MVKTWEVICKEYERLAKSDIRFLSMYNFLVYLKNSKYSKYIYGWTSMYDLNVVQHEVRYPYDGPRLLISPLENNKIKFKYVDTYKAGKQWQRTYDVSEAFQRLETFFFDIHWFYPNFIEE